MSESTAEPADGSSRTSYLLDGRRVELADLLRGGLLKDGELLTFSRPRIGETHRATVTAKGWIRLEDGEEVRSPSKAATIAVGSGSFDGWEAWQVNDGRYIGDLRQQLLDEAARETASRGSSQRQQASMPLSERHARLKEAAEFAASGRPRSLTVLDLLSWWGVSGRGTVNEQIEADLANHSLATSPEFDKVPLTALVRLVKAMEADAAEEALAGAPSPTDAGQQEPRETGLTVGTLPSALGDAVVSVKPTATFEEAITLMSLHDFSQLPVLISPHNSRGAVSWKSIARARHADPDASFSQAVIDAREVRYDHDLVDLLPVLAEFDFVLVKDQNNKIAGIVTAADVAKAYGDLASHFLLIGEMDRRLRQVIADAFSLDEVTGLCDPNGERVSSFGDLTIGDYQRVLENTERWEQLGWPLDRKVFVGWLEQVRKIRNNVMHFNSSDPLPRADVDKIRSLNRLLREYGE